MGIVLLQMLLGLNVTERFSDVHSAIFSCMPFFWWTYLSAFSDFPFSVASISPSLSRTAREMIEPPKRNHITCLSLRADLSVASQHADTAKSAPIAINGEYIQGISG